MVISNSVRKKPVPIKYNNIYTNKNDSNKLEALSKDKAIAYANKGEAYKDDDFKNDLDYILSRGVDVPADYEIIEIS